jgi:hypothetical protein
VPLDIHKPPATKRGDPSVATWLTAFVPGAGHLYLGQTVLGLAIFAVIEGIFLLGIKLSHGMSLQYLDPELRMLIAPALMPEVGNAGALLWQLKTYGFGGTLPDLWPSTMRIGSMLTATSGIANAFAMVHAHMLARTGNAALSAKPAGDVALGWLVPGLGHVAQGRRVRGAIVFALLVGLFVAGTLLAEGSNLSRERHVFYWGGQFIIGLPAIVGELVWGNLRVDHDIAYVDVGLVFACVAGLLNVLALIDVYAYREAKLLGLPLKTSGEPAGSAPAAAPASTANDSKTAGAA